MQMNPMSDVPVSGLFTAALALSLSRVRGAAFFAGVIVSLAICVRPNLAPLGAIFLGWFVARAGNWGERARAVLSFGLGAFPLIAAIAATNAIVHGAPWNSGYGPLDAYYAWGYFLPNLKQYGAWLVSSETPMVALLAVPLLTLRRFGGERRARLLFIALFAAGVWLCYMFYTPYDAWWYLRFLLPAYPPMLVLAVVGLRQMIGRFAPSRRLVAFAAVMIVVLAVRIQRVQEQRILQMWESEAVYTSAAAYIRNELPPNAVIFTVMHSGSVRYYADRLTVRWDWIGAEWWPRALAILGERGLRPYLLVSGFEEGPLRRQFGYGDAEDAPGTIVAHTPNPFGVVLYDPLREYTGTRHEMPTVLSCPCTIR
jgi:hypothetical protein